VKTWFLNLVFEFNWYCYAAGCDHPWRACPAAAAATAEAAAAKLPDAEAVTAMVGLYELKHVHP
jgi:hypothetical protein